MCIRDSIFHLNQVQVLPFSEDIHGDVYLYYALDSNHKQIIEEFIHTIQPIKYQSSH